MLLVEIIGLLGFVESTHLQLRNGETVLVDSINNFAGLSVTVWFDHGESSSCLRLKLVLGEEISIINEPELSREHGDN